LDASDLQDSGAVASLPPASLFDALPDAVLRFDAAARVIYVNPAFERATALPRRCLLGRRLGEVDGLALYAELWEGQLRELLQTEEERWFKFGYEHPLGRRHFDVRLLLERDELSPHVTALLRDVTYARGVTRASRGADALTEAMLEAVNVGTALLDRQLRLKHFNGFMEELTGVMSDRALGRGIDEVIDLSGRPEVMSSLEAMRRGEVRETEQSEYVLPAGDHPWVRERRTPIFDARGAFDGVFILVERVDPARMAETSLSALRGALEQAGELILEVGADGVLVDANHTALQQLGLNRAEIGVTPIGLIDRDLDTVAFEGLLERVRLHGADRREAHYMTRLRPGAAIPVEVIAQRSGFGQRESILLLARDIGERRRAETALLESAERFRSLFDDSPVALLVLDENLRVLQANGAAARLLDQASIDLVGVEIAALLAPSDLSAAGRLRRGLAAEALHDRDADVRIVHAEAGACCSSSRTTPSASGRRCNSRLRWRSSARCWKRWRRRLPRSTTAGSSMPTPSSCDFSALPSRPLWACP
jgi:PAS domain S-box-containing protein